MICQNCLRRLARRNRNAPSTASLTSHPQRSFTTSPARRLATPVTAQTATATNPRPNDLPAATSTSAAQPFSTPLTPAPKNEGDLPIQAKQSKDSAARIASSVPAGTVLKGLNFMKNKTDPIALEDHEYPAWLWEVLHESAEKGEGGAAGGEGDLFSKSKKQRRLAAKALRKQQLLNPESLAPKVPLYEQSVDLPRGDGTVDGARTAGAARQELTKAMRDQRRKKIKEDNFLKEMR